MAPEGDAENAAGRQAVDVEEWPDGLAQRACGGCLSAWCVVCFCRAQWSAASRDRQDSSRTLVSSERGVRLRLLCCACMQRRGACGSTHQAQPLSTRPPSQPTCNQLAEGEHACIGGCSSKQRVQQAQRAGASSRCSEQNGRHAGMGCITAAASPARLRPKGRGNNEQPNALMLKDT